MKNIKILLYQIYLDHVANNASLKIKSENNYDKDQIIFTTGQLESIRSAIDCSVANQALELEDQMGLLATAVSAAPF